MAHSFVRAYQDAAAPLKPIAAAACATAAAAA